MDETGFDKRLTEIITRWSVVRQAQGKASAKAQTAQEQVFQRYGGAVSRYLQAALQDSAAVEELTQEFALALVEGKFHKANPEKGRFRDYLKGVLFNLIQKYRRRQFRQPALVATPEELESTSSEAEEREQQFRESWRDELVARSWAALAEANADFFVVLHHRATHPKIPIEQMVRELAPQLGKDLTAEGGRQTLHRARKLFADLLLDEVVHSLPHPTTEDIQQELSELGLLPYFQAARGKKPRQKESD